MIIRKYTSRTWETSRPKAALRSVPTRCAPATTAQKPGVVRRRQHRDRIGGDAEDARVPERRQAGVAEQQVQAHRQDGEDEQLSEQADPVRRQNTSGATRDAGAQHGAAIASFQRPPTV